MILFIDDEGRRMKSYVEALQLSDYQVEFKYDIDESFEFFENNQGNIELLILDVMMPSGNIFDTGRTDGGLKTGIFLHSKIRNDNSSIPIIILTNISNEELLSTRSDKTLILQKDRVLPFELVENVDRILKNH